MSVKVEIRTGAIKSIETAAAEARPLETGGLLLGWWSNNGVIIELAVEVPDSAATQASWQRNESASQIALEGAIREYGHPWLGYVGDWHSHIGIKGASTTDIANIERVSLQFGDPVVLLVHRLGDSMDVRAARSGRQIPAEVVADEETRAT